MKFRRKNGAPISFSLPRRLLALFLIFVLTIYVVGIAVSVWLGNDAERQVREVYVARVDSLAEQLDAEFERIQLQINYTMTRPDIQHLELVTDAIQFSEIYDLVREVSELMYALQNSSGLIEDASIFLPRLERVISADGTYRKATEADYTFAEVYNEHTDRRQLMTSGGELYLVSDSARLLGSSQVSLIRVKLSRRAMSEWCSLFSENSRICLFSAQNSEELFRLSTGDMTDPDGDIRADMQAAVESGKAETDAETISIGGRECIRVLERVGTRELWVGGYVSTSVLRSASLPFWLWQVILTAFLLLEMCLFLYIIRKMISQPINRFVTAAQNLEAEGVFQLSDQPADNMDFLYQAFVGVSAKLKATLEQTYKSKLLAYQSEIKFLQAQVNPHFLYNSFYHLYRMARMEDNEGVAEMSRRLSSYYRYITRSDQNVVPLSMEYENIQDYTEIQIIRFGDRIQVDLESLPEQYASLEVPRFVLQPLFENAYNHGVEKMTSGCIRLRFEEKPGALVILVENNGTCTDEELAALTQYLENTEPGQKITALKNVKERMKLLGGDLAVSRGALGGFCVALTLVSTRPNKEESEDVHTSGG